MTDSLNRIRERFTLKADSDEHWTCPLCSEGYPYVHSWARKGIADVERLLNVAEAAAELRQGILEGDDAWWFDPLLKALAELEDA